MFYSSLKLSDWPESVQPRGSTGYIEGDRRVGEMRGHQTRSDCKFMYSGLDFIITKFGLSLIQTSSDKLSRILKADFIVYL